MTKVFAIFFQLPFEKRTLCIYEINNVIKIEEGYKLISNNEVICINLNDYLNSITETYNIPSRIFDINVAVRMLNGYSKSNFMAENAPWNGISCLGKHFDQNIFSSFKAVENGKFGNYLDWVKSLPSNWYDLLIKAVKNEYERVVLELQNCGLYEQFTAVEMPLEYIFSCVGNKGIQIDQSKLKSKYLELDKEYYQAIKILEIDYGFKVEKYTKKVNYEDIWKYVKELNQDDFSTKYFWESVELMQKTNQFLKCLLTEHRNRSDINELLRIWSSLSDTCKLSYDIYGTVSGRILVNRPGIQYLKKTSRGIFKPQTGYEFIYADYAQFEPGILAAISDDKLLIDIYNTGDVYLGLASVISKSCTREVAKELFLSFIYGMSNENIKARIVRNFNEKSGELADNFFSQFIGIQEWKKQIVESVKQTGVAKGVFKYLRRVHNDDSERDIARWAPNHIVQSTASGIFKRALVNIVKQVKDCRLLIPMHDAILIECPSEVVGETQKSIERIMLDSFQESCQGVKAKITFDSFSKN